MYETLMEAAVEEENCRRALKAVKRNDGAAGIDRMTTKELEEHLQANWWILKDKLLKGTYVPSPVRRKEVRKLSGGGMRMLGIPTVQDRFIQQMLLQVMTPIFDPSFSEHSYGFRPGRSAPSAPARNYPTLLARNGPPPRRTGAVLAQGNGVFLPCAKCCESRPADLRATGGYGYVPETERVTRLRRG